jgi:hypothetical protein
MTRIGELRMSAVTSKVLPLLVTANLVPSTPILVTLMLTTIPSSETSVLTRATRHNIAQEDILHNLEVIFWKSLPRNGMAKSAGNLENAEEGAGASSNYDAPALNSIL